MDNYEFCAQWAMDQDRGREVAILDYGCGAGQIVEKIKVAGVTVFGGDIFYGGCGLAAKRGSALA